MSAWTYKEAVHLLNRAGFGGTPEEIAACVRLGCKESVRRLIGGISLTGKNEELAEFNTMYREADKKRPLLENRISDWAQYWIYRMAYSQFPLVEKMTLFWHGHFTSAESKVDETRFMQVQNRLLRQYALGDFRELAHKIGKDRAMMVYLDLDRSRKDAPNENYAREFMEIFTLGIRNFTEQDVKELARAFTGWRFGDPAFIQDYWVDKGTKTLLGVTGNLGYTEAVNIILSQPAYPKFMAKKLLRFFAVDNPDQVWIDHVANNISKMKTMGEVLQELFTSNEFYNPKYRMAVIKAPADYVAGTIRALQMYVFASDSSEAAKYMGQFLFMPPNVAGWPGGEAWLEGLMSRYSFSGNIAAKTDINKSEFKPAQPADPDAWIDVWCKRFGIAELSQNTRAGLRSYVKDTIINSSQPLAGMRGLMRLVLLCPEMQMK
ncbi:hypothetical protein GCM10008018_14020 [Paenibacillus marchantiophytorum]|uniref:DUF1800 domain-containing protein n=1 Tax=Paenibacillus marchantiophytorum TaxID=1619310 RepID=A0ABQ2BTN4_9BACL|nr:DUF1800 domain-containing protein [Paenibacillus marchantiophytorum]GGI45817.1 hypothetical protein GCM10008018_14020 [Paenibacillus marchantiophytorum]